MTGFGRTRTSRATLLPAFQQVWCTLSLLLICKLSWSEVCLGNHALCLICAGMSFILPTCLRLFADVASKVKYGQQTFLRFPENLLNSRARYSRAFQASCNCCLLLVTQMHHAQCADQHLALSTQRSALNSPMVAVSSGIFLIVASFGFSSCGHAAKQDMLSHLCVHGH